MLLMFKFRDYQKKAIMAGVNFFTGKSKKNSIIVSPTGSGKSFIIAGIAAHIEGAIIVFQPSRELLEQNYDKFISYGGKATIYSASVGIKEISNITFATIGSLKGKSDLFKHVKNIIIDECHLVPPDKESMYMKFFTGMGVKILGLTATPIRLKNYNFPEPHSKLCMLDRMRPRVFVNYIHITQVQELVDKGYFAKTKYYNFDFDRSKLVVNTTGSDYTEKSIAETMERFDIIKQAEEKIKGALNKGRKHILVFVATIAQAMDLSKRVNGEYVAGVTKKSVRKSILERFKAGAVRVVVNVGVLIVGFDFPALDTIVLARPTLSLAMYYQMIGRGSRPDKNKDFCLIIDLVNNYKSFGRVEDLVIENRNGWGIYSKEKLLTNVDISDDGIGIPEEDLTELDKKIWDHGKYKGMMLCQLPKRYIDWYVDNVKERKYNRIIFEYSKITRS